MIASIIVDTDVFCYVLKGDTRAALYARHLQGAKPHLSFATVAELYRWATHYGWAQPRIDRLRAMIAKYTILYPDDLTAWHWARVMSIKGRPIGHGDAWIAAVAVRHGLSLVTHNRKHFEAIPGLTVISEG